MMSSFANRRARRGRRGAMRNIVASCNAVRLKIGRSIESIVQYTFSPTDEAPAVHQAGGLQLVYGRKWSLAMGTVCTTSVVPNSPPRCSYEPGDLYSGSRDPGRKDSRLWRDVCELAGIA